LRFEPAHLAWRRCATFRRFAADDPAHRWIVAQSLGVVHILVSCEPAEHRLTQHADQRMTAVLSRARVSQCFAGRRAQTERVIEFAIGEQTGIGCYNGAAKLHRHAAVKIYAKSIIFRFTRRVRHASPDRSSKTCCYYSEIDAIVQQHYAFIWEMRVELYQVSMYL
jgi:hypothetical protein